MKLLKIAHVSAACQDWQTPGNDAASGAALPQRDQKCTHL
jgi:hypothetical protein